MSALTATLTSCAEKLCGVDIVLGWHDGPATEAAKAYAAIETACAVRAGELIAEHGLDELVNKKHEGGGVKH
ncbi:hypothetical protein NFJ02_24g55460 [Pycnococcus provasolii]